MEDILSNFKQRPHADYLQDKSLIKYIPIISDNYKQIDLFYTINYTATNNLDFILEMS